MDEELHIPKTASMSTVLATLSAASMRLGQPLYIDLSLRMADMRIGVAREHYDAWKGAISGGEKPDTPLSGSMFTSIPDDSSWRVTIRAMP